MGIGSQDTEAEQSYNLPSETGEPGKLIIHSDQGVSLEDSGGCCWKSCTLKT